MYLIFFGVEFLRKYLTKTTIGDIISYRMEDQKLEENIGKIGKIEKEMIWEALSRRGDAKVPAFLRIINEAPLKEDKERAFQEILKLPNVDGAYALCCLVNTASDESYMVLYKEKAWTKLMDRHPDNAIFRNIIKHGTGSYPEAAWRILKTQKITLEEIRDLLEKAPEDYKDKVSEWVLSSEFKDDHDALCLVIQFGSKTYQFEAWTKLLEKGPSEGDLRNLILWATTEYKALAWAKLLEQEPSDACLDWLSDHAPREYAEKAYEILKKRDVKRQQIEQLPTEKLVELLITPS